MSEIKNVKINDIDVKGTINWSNLSREICKKDRGTVRSNQRIPRHMIPVLDRFFKEDVPAWWEEYRQQFL